MKKTPYDWIGLLLLLAAVALLAPYLSHLLAWSYEEGHLPLKPRYYNLALGGLVTLLVLLRRPAFSLLSLGFLLAPALRVLDAAVLRRFIMLGVVDDHATFVLNLLSNLLISLCAILCLTDRRGFQVAQAVAMATILMVAGGIYGEALGFSTMTTDPGRMAGFLGDPNAGPIVICLMLGVLFTLQRRFWLNLALVAIVAPAVALTSSRSGMAVFALLVLAYLARNFLRHAMALALIVGLGVPAAIVGLASMPSTLKQLGPRDTKVESRLQAIYEQDLVHQGAREQGNDLEDSWEAVMHRPLFGYGTGSATAHGQPSNAVVSLWLELGAGGVLLYLGPLLLLSCQCLFNRGRGFFCLAPVWLFIPCSQMLLDMPAYWLTVATCCHLAAAQRFRFTLLPRGPRAGHLGQVVPAHSYSSP